MSIPMPVITLSSAAKTSMSNPSEINQYKFSSYVVDETEETFVLKLGSTDVPSLTSSISIPHDRRLIYPCGSNQKTKDSEIGVFDAEKYFNEGLNLNQSPKLVRKSLPLETKRNELLKTFEIKEKPRLATPSVVSGSSSHNSRSALLLHNAPRRSKPKKTIKKSFLTIIGCNTSCCDRFSVDTNDERSRKSGTLSTEDILIQGRSRQVDYKGGDRHLVRRASNSDFSCLKFNEQGLRVNSKDHFSFPVFSTGDNQTTKKHVHEETDMPKQRSLQVFGSLVMENGKNCYSPEKNPTVMTWDSIPRASEEIKLPSNDILQNDSDSEASSDLFEIESFSKSNPFLSRQASDNGATCYAPSEASVEWSVVTASAADFSVLSDSEELKSNSISTIPCDKEKGFNLKIGSIDESSIKRRSSILSGCNSHKAVRIVEDVHKVNNEKVFPNVTIRGHRAESYTQTTRLSDETKVAGFVARNRQRSFDA